MSSRISLFKSEADILGITDRTELQSYVRERQSQDLELAKLEMAERQSQKKMELENQNKEKELALEVQKQQSDEQIHKDKTEAERLLQKEKLALDERIHKDKTEAERLVQKENSLRREQDERESLERNSLERLKLDHEREIQLAKLNYQDQADRRAVDEQGDRSSTRLHNAGMDNPRTRLDVPFLKSTLKEDVDNYFVKFQKLMSLWSIPKSQWNSLLVPRLPDDMSAIFNRLPENSIDDYDMLYKAIQTKYLLTGQYYASKFRNTNQMIGETAVEFISRTNTALMYWLKSEKIDQDFESICDFLVKDQIFFSWNKSDSNKTLFIKERAPNNLGEVAKIADLYDTTRLECRKFTNRFNTGNQNNGSQNFSGNQVNQNSKGVNGKTQGEQNNANQNKFYSHNRNEITGSNQVNREKFCLYCQSNTHSTAICFKKPQDGNPRGPFRSESTNFRPHNSPGKGNNGRMPPRRDQNPQTQVKHVAAVQIVSHPHEDWTQTDENVNYSKSSTDDEIITEQTNVLCTFGDREIQQCGCTLLIHPNVEENEKEGYNPYSQGLVNGIQTQVMRDTGASVCICRKEFVRPEQYTGKKIHIKMLDGTILNVPSAIVDLETKFYSGKQECIILDNPITSLILGNMPNMGKFLDPELTRKTCVARKINNKVGNFELTNKINLDFGKSRIETVDNLKNESSQENMKTICNKNVDFSPIVVSTSQEVMDQEARLVELLPDLKKNKKTLNQKYKQKIKV